MTVATAPTAPTKPTGYVFRRRFTRVEYPESPEAFAAAGYVAERWNEGYVGFWADIRSSITGLDERTELDLRRAFESNPTDATKEAYRRELALRVPRWGYATENAAGGVEPVPAPGEGTGSDNWDAFDLLPGFLAAWLTIEVRSIHLPKRPVPMPVATSVLAEGEAVS